MGNIIAVNFNDVWCHHIRKLPFSCIYMKWEACVFKTLHFGEQFEKICFRWLFLPNRLGQTGEKNFHLQTKTVTCGKGLLNFNNNLNNSLCSVIKSTKRISVDIYDGKDILKLGKLCEKQVKILSHKVARFCRCLYNGGNKLAPHNTNKSHK